jgi:uncharacterized Zn-binding protein involved in type VI secretion
MSVAEATEYATPSGLAAFGALLTRMGDNTVHGGVIVMGFPMVIIGG